MLYFWFLLMMSLLDDCGLSFLIKTPDGSPWFNCELAGLGWVNWYICHKVQFYQTVSAGTKGEIGWKIIHLLTPKLHKLDQLFISSCPNQLIQGQVMIMGATSIRSQHFWEVLQLDLNNVKSENESVDYCKNLQCVKLLHIRCCNTHYLPFWEFENCVW